MPQFSAPQSVLLVNGTILDGVSDAPIQGKAVWIEGDRVKAIEAIDAMPEIADAFVVDAAGKFIIPGLLNANVHLFLDTRLENLVRYEGRYDALIVEAAQVTLRGGVTTVFDTWGPRRHLIAVRDQISSGELVGSRMFLAGNVVGFDGPLSADFWPDAPKVASGELVRHINALWAENIGPDLVWETPEGVAAAVREHALRGIDFVKYAANDHLGANLAFSERAQSSIVEAAHTAGLTAQAHIHSVEGLRIAVEAGCDLIQHANVTGPIAIPQATLDLLATRGTGTVVFPFTERRLGVILSGHEWTRRTYAQVDGNCRSLLRSGAPILLATDGGIFAAEATSDPLMKNGWAARGEDNLADLAEGHFFWLKAMEEKGMPAMAMLQAATSNIARAYGKSDEIGSIAPGKRADILILDANPLLSWENYRRIHLILKDGEIVNREVLPIEPLLTSRSATDGQHNGKSTANPDRIDHA